VKAGVSAKGLKSANPEEAPVPGGQMALALLQEIGAGDVVEADRASLAIETEEQGEVMELAAELLGGERAGAPELFQDVERDVLVLGKIASCSNRPTSSPANRRRLAPTV